MVNWHSDTAVWEKACLFSVGFFQMYLYIPVKNSTQLKKRANQHHIKIPFAWRREISVHTTHRSQLTFKHARSLSDENDAL